VTSASLEMVSIK